MARGLDDRAQNAEGERGANSKSGRQIRRVSKYTDHNRMLIKKYPKELTHSLIDITRSLEAKERRGAKTGDNGRGSRRRKKKERKKKEKGICITRYWILKDC